MGGLVGRLKKLLEKNSNKTFRILLLGLDGAGKTTILYRLKTHEEIVTIPTVGFNVETLTPYKGINLTVWDVGGQDKIRQLWKHYYNNINGLFYVIDSADHERIDESIGEFYDIINRNNMFGLPIVLILNKQDLDNAFSCSEIIERFDLTKLNYTKNKWFVQTSCATAGDGIEDAVDKMIEMIDN